MCGRNRTGVSEARRYSVVRFPPDYRNILEERGFDLRVGADGPSAQPSEARLPELSPARRVALDGKETGIMLITNLGAVSKEAAAGLAPGCPDEGISTPSSQKRA